MKNFILVISLFLVSSSANAQKKDKTYKVLASCGQCQLDMNTKKGCDLAIQYAGKKYWVEGSGIEDHGDSHASEGFCNAIRKAKVTGTFKENQFYATSFVLIQKKKKKKK
jgi:hypothetical protein